MAPGPAAGNGAARTRAVVDLGVVLGVFLLCSAAEPALDPVLRRGQGLPGVLALAAYQFACEGVAVFAVLLWRREAPSEYAFRRPHVIRSIALAVLLAAANDLAASWWAQEFRWLPFGRHHAARMATSSGALAVIPGLVVTVGIWGMVEAFFGVFFARKLSVIARHDGRGWLAPGALGFATFNGAIHFAIGQGVTGFTMSFASGYAIAVIPAVTGNAWGSAVFQALTNAVGPA